MAFKCEHCHFNFQELDLTVKMDVLMDDRLKAVDGDRIRLHCPACGIENWLELKPFGILHSNNKLFQWRSATSRLKNPNAPIPLGGLLYLDIYEKAQTLSEKEICYPKIPVFRQINRQLSIPRWPVRPEYWEFIDTERDLKPEIVQDEYRIQLPLKGLKDPLDIRLPFVPVKQERTALGENGAFKGVHLVMWPNIPYKEWNRYFLRFGWSGETDESPINQARGVRVYSYARRGLDSNKKEWVPVDALASDGQTLFGCVDSRPELIAIEFISTNRGEVIGGGIWSIASAVQEGYPEIAGTALAVDFGTSNTCVAVGGDSEAHFIPVESCDDYVIHGSDLPKTVTFADTWPPRQGFGKRRSLFPTEILTREPLEEVRLKAERIKQWKPVVDYGIPTGGANVVFDEEKHLLADFKWDQMVGDAVFRGQTQELQKRYIEFILLFALAQLANEGKSIGKIISVRFSYPLAFDTDQKASFEQVLEEVAQSVGKMTGFQLTCELQMDEARAAASSISPAGKKAFLYVDVGGGSSDIALEIRRINEKKQEYSKYVNIASVQYAGGGLVEALHGGRCLITNLSGFRRLIREAGHVKELMRRGNVFHPHKSQPINSKASYFYGYLMEFLSRLLAAHIITGEYKQGMSEEEIEYTKQNGYPVALYALGNGWGFGHLFDPDYARAVFAPDLRHRTNEILQEATQVNGDEQVPGVDVEVPDGFGISDPKAAVVFGLLKDEGTKANDRELWAFKTIVGCTTRVGSTRTVPWYLPVTNRGSLLPDKQEELPKAIVDCPKEEGPPFHKKLMTPHELDPGLNQVRNQLSKCVGEKWFIQSPLHVLMEKLFKPKLKDLL